MSIKQLSRREVYRNKWIRLYEDDIERDNGAQGIYAFIEKDPAVIIIPLERTSSGEEYVWLVGQFRYPIQQHYWEFPQGGWEEAHVDPVELAVGELREETGISAGRMTKLSMLWIAYGAMKQEHYVFLAEDLTLGEPEGRDAEEHDIETRRVSVREFEDMLLDGSMADNCSAAAWGLYKVWRERNAASESSSSAAA